MKIADFSGGLSNRLDPILVAPNEALVYDNIDNEKMTLTSTKGLLSTGININNWAYKFNSKWYSSSQPRDYLEYRNNLYWTEAVNRGGKVSNGVTKPLGLKPPTVKLTSVQGATGVLVAGVVQYTYTYYDSSDGTESFYAPLTDELTISASKTVDLSGFTLPVDGNADKIRIYRIGQGTTEPTMIAEVSSTTATYNDNIAALNAPGNILDTDGNMPPIDGLRFLTESFGTFFGAKGPDLYFTKEGKPDYWPSINVMSFSQDITGIAMVSEGVLIFTKNKTYIIIGDQTTFRRASISNEYGCINFSSIRVVKNHLVWLGLEGLYTYYNGTINIVSKSKLGSVKIDSVSAVAFEEQFWLVLTNGTLLVIDFRYSDSYIVKTFSFPMVEVQNITKDDDFVYAISNGVLYRLFAGEDLYINYLSPSLTEGDATVVKLYNNVYVRADGKFTVTIYVDDVEVCSNFIEGNQIFDLKVPQEKQRGSSIQFGITGYGSIKEIEYKTVGRENGR